MSTPNPFDDDEYCNLCKTSLLNNPKLLLLYSNCCGYAVCQDCITGKYQQKKDAIICAVCDRKIPQRDFSKENLDAQFFRVGAEIRHKIDKTMNMQLEDFGSRRDYNDYLEFKMEIEYDMVYGSPAEKKEAEEKVSKFYEEHKEKVNRNRSKAVVKERDQAVRGKLMQASEEGEEQAKEAGASQLPQQLGGGLQVMALPMPEKESNIVTSMDDMVKFQKKTDEKNRADWKLFKAMSPEEQRNFLYRKDLMRRAEGWSQGYYTRRCYEEAFCSLFE